MYQDLLPFRSTSDHPRCFGGVRIAQSLVFLCCFLYTVFFSSFFINFRANVKLRVKIAIRDGNGSMSLFTYLGVLYNLRHANVNLNIVKNLIRLLFYFQEKRTS